MFDLCLSITRRDGDTGSVPNKRFLVSKSRRLPRRLDEAELGGVGVDGVDGVGLGVLYPLVPLTALLWPLVPSAGRLCPLGRACPLVPLATGGVTKGAGGTEETLPLWLTPSTTVVLPLVLTDGLMSVVCGLVGFDEGVGVEGTGVLVPLEPLTFLGTLFPPLLVLKISLE